jgi:tripartite motif-containing protein 71
VYVAGLSDNRIQKFTSDGSFITAWGSTGSGNGQFDNPTGIDLDSSNNVYVADSRNNRIQVFSPMM